MSKLTDLVARLTLKVFQLPVFWSNAKTLVLHWSRQIGKSYVLAAWAVYRVLTKTAEGKDWLVVVLSNSKDNGTEFMQKVAQICGLLRLAFEAQDLSPDEFFENMRIECRFKINGHEGRVKVLAANPRTARGFSGDLILDEFAFHEDSYAIWDAAEPILASNKEFQCRIASTGNGCYNMFYNIVSGAAAGADAGNPAGLSVSGAGFLVSRVARSAAYLLGQKIYDLKGGGEITPEAARARALDKASYDQNYELAFNDENMALLTLALINGAEYKNEAKPECYICEQEISPSALAFLEQCRGPLFVGLDIGRKKDFTALAVSEEIGGVLFTRLMLKLSNMRLPDQQRAIAPVLRLPQFGSLEGDETGLGLGLIEYTQDEAGAYRVHGVNFASTEAVDPDTPGANQRKTAPVTELMALDLLRRFEERSVRIPRDPWLQNDLKKPTRIQQGNRVRIAATSDEAGHADGFWALALMERARRFGVSGLASTEGIFVGGNANAPQFTPRHLNAGGDDE